MSEMHGRVVIYLIALATTLSQIAGELIVAPRNTESKIGDTTYFNCSTDLEHSEIFWHHGDKDIYTGNGILEPYNGRFDIDRNASIGSHNLVIHSVESGDAGEYICADDEGYRERLSAQLIVLDNDPDCQSNIQPDGVIGQNIFNIAPDEVQLTCTVTYHGNIPPQLEWSKVGDVNSSTKDSVTSNVTYSNHLMHTLKLKGDISLDNSSYVCHTKRSTQNQYKCTSEIAKVLYFIGENMTEQNVIRGGDITCTASNNTFPCISQWYHDNYTCPLSCDETIIAHVLGAYLCMVRCIVRGKDYSFEAMKVVVVEPTTTPPPSATESSPTRTIIISVVVSVVFAVVVVGVLLFVFLWILRRRGGYSKAPTEEDPLSENHIIRNNYQFLVENIKSNRLIDLLHEKNCITNEERDYFNEQPDNFYRNEALLQWIRAITSNVEKLQKVLKCFRQVKQNLIADMLEKGGVFIKSKISTNLLNERQLCSSLTKSSSTNAEELKEKEAMVIEILKKPQGLSLSSIQPATSEIPDDDIFVTPYCHQETNGIVIWFWCQSKNGETNLQRMSESDILLQKLITIFKEFVNNSVSSVSEILVPNSTTIFVGDFTKNETIYGLAVLRQEVFIVRLLRRDIEVYDSMTFRLKRRMKVEGMKNPENLVSCSLNNCLYAFDWDYQEQDASDWDNQGQTHAILRIDPIDGNLIKTWKIDGGGGRLSVASDTNVILNLNYKAKLYEYTADGELIREIDLDPMCTGINRSWHALKLDNGEFIVCDGGEGDPLSRVCLLSVKSTNSGDEAEFLKAFGAERGESIDILWGPTYLSVDNKGSILVSDASKKTLLLSSNLDEPQIIVSEEHGLMESRTTCFDELTGQWFVAGQKRVMVCRVKNKEVERKLYYLI